jgi:lysophospholipase L1-like esterase
MRTTLCLCVVLAGCGGQVDGPATNEQAAMLGDGLRYLALGDSIAFGFDPRAAPTDPTAFVGYPEQVSADTRLGVANAACEGETSGSFLDVTAPDYGCHAWRHDGDTMHVDYASDSQSQLAFAVAWLHTHWRTRLVTIGIGANDLLLAQLACDGDTTCTLGKLPGVAAGIAANVSKIAATLRLAGYFGKIVVVNYYSLDYTDLAQQLALGAVNQALEEPLRAVGARVADSYGAWALASLPYGGNPCAAGLLIPLTTDGSGNPLTCDKHPSPAGRTVIAHAVELAAF